MSNKLNRASVWGHRTSFWSCVAVILIILGYMIYSATGFIQP